MVSGSFSKWQQSVYIRGNFSEATEKIPESVPNSTGAHRTSGRRTGIGRWALYSLFGSGLGVLLICSVEKSP